MFGISARLIAEITCGEKSTCLLFDRGEDSQGVEDKLARADIVLTDRFILADMGILFRLNIAGDEGECDITGGGFTTFCEGEVCIIGREEDEVFGRKSHKVLSRDPDVSGRHARISVQADKVTIADLCSTNGTGVTVDLG